MCSRCVRIVAFERLSACAASALVIPLAINWRTSVSRSDSIAPERCKSRAHRSSSRKRPPARLHSGLKGVGPGCLCRPGESAGHKNRGDLLRNLIFGFSSMAVPAARNSILDLVGPTPVVQLGNVASPKGAAIFAKLEHLNPTGSHKDRIAAAMVDQAEAEGWLSPGARVIEASCGNLGVALALVCAVRGYRLVLAMPRSVNPEFLPLIQAYGAQLELTPAELGIAGAIARAKQLLAGSPGAYMPAQYENPMNVIAHRRATGAELVRAVELSGKKAAAFVMTLATGGTFCGVGEAMRDAFPAIHLAAVQVRPHLGASSPLR